MHHPINNVYSEQTSHLSPTTASTTMTEKVIICVTASSVIGQTRRINDKNIDLNSNLWPNDCITVSPLPLSLLRWGANICKSAPHCSTNVLKIHLETDVVGESRLLTLLRGRGVYTKPVKTFCAINLYLLILSHIHFAFEHFPFSDCLFVTPPGV